MPGEAAEPEEPYRIDILKVGEMDRVPNCLVYWLEGIGTFEPFCYTMLVLRNRARTVVVNTGFPTDVEPARRFWKDEGLDLRRPDELLVGSQLARIGVDPAEVSDLFLTPIGPYNTGNISLFTTARVHMLKRAWASLMGLDDELPRLPAVAMPESEKIHLVTTGFDRLELLPDEARPLPGIQTFHVGVHHPGSMALAIATSQGTAVFSDAFFKFGNIELMKPIGYCQDLRECRKSYRRIAAEADLLLPMYDPAVFERYPGGVIA